MPDNYKDIVAAMLDRLKESLGISNDRDLAEILGLSQQVMSGWRSRGYIDIFKLIHLTNISFDYIIKGEKTKELEVKEPSPLYKPATTDQKQGITADQIEIIKLSAKIELLEKLLKEKEGELKQAYADSSGRQSSRAEHILPNIRK